MPERHQTDVDIRRIAAFAGGLILLVAAVVLLTHASLGSISRGREPGASRRSPLARDVPPPEPRLQTSPAGDLEAMRARERAILDSYGWIDRSHGVVRVPIDEARKMVLKKGLPAR